MTIDEQLRDLASRVDQHQQVITADEVVRLASGRRTGSFTKRSGVDGQHISLTDMRVPFTEEEDTMIDLDREVGDDSSRKWPTRGVAAAILAAAVVIGLAFVAIREEDPVSPVDRPSTTVSATLPPTPPPEALFGRSDVRLAPGTYVVDEVEGTPTPPILVTIGDGWRSSGDWAIYKGGGQVMTFSRPERVFLDACRPSDGDHPGPLTTLDGLVTALHEQAGWIDVTVPSDISIDGYAGKAFQRSTPGDLSECDGDFMSWGGSIATSSYPPGDTETVWVLDLDGTVVVLETRVNAGQPAQAHAELAAVLDSIRIGDPS